MATNSISRSRPVVGLLIETSTAYGRGLLRGVLAHTRENDRWSLFVTDLRRGDRPPRSLRRWRGAGLIARIENDSVARTVEELNIPTIDVSAARLLPEIPYVETDDQAIAQMAYDHLFSRGFRHLAFCGDKRYKWSVGRRDHFVACAQQSGADCFLYESSRRRSWEEEVKALSEWLDVLPRPIGIMASYDQLGRDLLEACREANVRVPEEAAIIGVDNDELLCDLADPPMSSVVPNAQRIGFLAASYLARLMSGGSDVPIETRVEPLTVQTRQSTDVLAIEDAATAMAAGFIRDHACDGIKVADVLSMLNLSRRVVETRFRKYIGRSPHEEILRIQLEHVRQLLRETDLTVEKIAYRTGFKHVEYMSVVFKRELGQTPSGYRAQFADGRQ